MSGSALSIVLEFARIDSPEDPYAFQFGHQGYTLRTTSGGRKRVELDWSEEFLDHLQMLGEPSADPGSVQRIGRQLRTFLEPAGWAWTSRQIVDAVHRAEPVHLTIRSAAAELYALPWELLTLEGTGQCVGEIPGLLVRYEWPETASTPAVSHESGRILVAWSAAAGAVPSEQHIAAIASAARESDFDFDPERDVIRDASIGRIADVLDEAARSQRPVRAIHILCHGGVSGDVHGLVFDGEVPGSEAVVDAWRLRQLLAPFGGTIRMVVLSACDSANASGLFDSAALALHRAGVQSVIASRFLFSVAGSISLTRTLYHELLAEKRSLEEAFLRARRAVSRDATKLDWASLQLYARTREGHETFPFDTPESHPAEVVTGELEPLDDERPALERIDYQVATMADLVTLRSRVRYELRSRFERTMAIMVMDLTGSAAQLVRAPETSPQSLTALVRGLIEAPVATHGGQVHLANNTRAIVCFPAVQQALDAAIDIAQAIVAHNYRSARDELIVPRYAVHYGSVLTDGDKLVGAASDAAIQIAAAGPGNMLWMSQEALMHTSTMIRAGARIIDGSEIISEGRRLEIFALTLGDSAAAPECVFVENTGERLALPSQDIISFGRLDKLPDGTPANDICLSLPDRESQLMISRWHFEVRRAPGGGFVVRVVSGQRTEVDGVNVAKDAEAPMESGTVVCLVHKVNLRIECRAAAVSTKVEMTRYV